METRGTGQPSAGRALRDRLRRPGKTVAVLAGALVAVAGATVLAQVAERAFGGPDETPPELTLASPAPGTPVRDPLTPIVFEASEAFVAGAPESFLKLASTSLTLDGVDVTSRAVVEALWPGNGNAWLPIHRARVTLTPTADLPLPEGEARLVLRMRDWAGNEARLEATVRVDSQPPVVTAESPESGSLLTDRSVTLTYAVADATGVDAASLAVTVNGAARTEGVTLSGSQLTVAAPSGGWAPGPLAVQVAVADTLGNAGTSQFSYTVADQVELAAYPRAVPSQGEAPLAVTFIPSVITARAVVRYQWDFTGDGVFDRTEVVGSNQSWTYTTPGTFLVTLRITDNTGLQATGTVQVVVGNKAPVVTAEASPSNGAPPLAVTFTATATDSDGIAEYAWDFDGDGTYESTSTTNTASFTYTAAGIFRPAIRVTDRLGAATRLAVPSIEVRVVEGAPSVAATATPSTGNAPLPVSFNATATDPDGHAITEWAWDFDGDGTFDAVSTTSAAASFRYTAPGTYYARVRATAADGGTGIDVVRVTVNLSLALSLSTDTVDTGVGGSTNVLTTLGGDTEVSLVMEDRAGTLVRTLVPWGLRLSGSYTDAWDGRDAQGAAVPEGEYRAVLLYKLDGVVRRYDLGLTTGGVQSNPPRSSIPSRFSPLAGQPLSINFTLARASEVTAFMGRFNVDTRMVTFFQRQLHGRGTHTLTWNGENADGQLAHPPSGDAFLFGIFAYTLPNNAVFVRSGVHASGVSASPSILDPTGLADDGNPALSQVRFTLNRPGSVELQVYDATTGVELLQRRVAGLQAGQQVVPWDGRDGSGELVGPGRYRLGVTGIDEFGARSMTVFTPVMSSHMR